MLKEKGIKAFPIVNIVYISECEASNGA